MTDTRPLTGTADRRRAAAVEVAVRTGLLKRCPTHDEVYDPGQHDYQGACMVAAFLMNQAHPVVAAFDGDRAPLVTMLRSICEGYGRSCPRCPGHPPDPARAAS